MPVFYSPPPTVSSGPVEIPPSPIVGETNRFYRLMSATLRNAGAPNYWQPVNDASNRPQNIGTVTTGTSKVTIAHTLEGIKAISLVPTADDVLGAAGIRVTANVGLQSTDLTFVRSSPLSDFVEWNGSNWVFAKGSSSPFAVSGTVSVAHDAETQTAAFNTAAVHNTTHTPVGTPRGVVVAIVQQLNTTDEISGVTYGGVAMTRIRKQDRTGSMTETGSIYLYFLGSGIPTGAQTVAITSSGASNKRAVISTVTSTGNTTVDVNAGQALNTGADPSLALTFTGPLSDVVAYYAIGTGLASPVTTVQAGSTHQFGHDFGAESAMWARKTITSGSSTTIGYTATSDDQLQAALVVKGAVGASFPSGVLTISHADIGTADPSAVSIVGRGGSYIPVISTTGGATATEVNIEFYDYAGVKQTTAATGMAFSLVRPSTNQVLNPQTITTTAFPGSDITLYGVFEVESQGTGGGTDPPPPTDSGRPADTPIPPGGFTAEQSRVVELQQYKNSWFHSNNFWKRQLPSSGRTLYQHPTIPEANSTNWKNYLCANMGFDGTIETGQIPTYAAGHTDGMAWIRREGDMLYIVPPDQPYRDFFNIQAGIDTWATRMQAVIDRLGGLPVPYDVEGTSNPDKYVHVYKPDENMFMQFYLAGQLTAATTTLSIVNGPATSGDFHLAIDYGDNEINLATFTTVTPIPWNATAAQVKASVDTSRNPSNFMFSSGNTGRCTATGGPLNVAPVELRFAISKPLKPVWCRVTTSTLDAGSVAFAHVNAGPVERCRGGSVIAVLDDHPGVDQHPAVYRDWTFGGVFLEDRRWGGSATSIEYMAGIPSWEEVQDAQAAGTGLDHALPLVVGHAQLSPIPFVAPATRADGDRPNRPDAIAEGARVAFPPDIDLSYIETNHPEIMWLALTMRDYGCVIYDKTGAGCEFVFRRGSWVGSTFNPWRELLPLYGETGAAAHRYMRALPWHKAQVVDPSYSA